MLCQMLKRPARMPLEGVEINSTAHDALLNDSGGGLTQQFCLVFIQLKLGVAVFDRKRW